MAAIGALTPIATIGLVADPQYKSNAPNGNVEGRCQRYCEVPDKLTQVCLLAATTAPPAPKASAAQGALLLMHIAEFLGSCAMAHAQLLTPMHIMAHALVRYSTRHTMGYAPTAPRHIMAQKVLTCTGSMRFTLRCRLCKIGSPMHLQCPWSSI